MLALQLAFQGIQCNNHLQFHSWFVPQLGRLVILTQHWLNNSSCVHNITIKCNAINQEIPVRVIMKFFKPCSEALVQWTASGLRTCLMVLALASIPLSCRLGKWHGQWMQLSTLVVQVVMMWNSTSRNDAHMGKSAEQNYHGCWTRRPKWNM